MESVSLFSEKENFGDFWGKNANVSRPQGVHHVIHIYFGSSLG